MEVIQNPLVAESPLTIEPLDVSHDRAAFVCQEQPLTDYIKSDKALRDARDRNSSIYCCVDEKRCVKAYYALSAGGISRDSVARAMYSIRWRDKREERNKVFDTFPDDMIGVIVLRRIAIDKSLTNTGFGKTLIGHALSNAVEASRKAAAKAVYLEAKNETVAEIYQTFGFKPFPDSPLSMYILMETLEQADKQA